MLASINKTKTECFWDMATERLFNFLYQMVANNKQNKDAAFLEAWQI
jgi:hypothetical protein